MNPVAGEHDGGIEPARYGIDRVVHVHIHHLHVPHLHRVPDRLLYPTTCTGFLQLVVVFEVDGLQQLVSRRRLLRDENDLLQIFALVLTCHTLFDRVAFLTPGIAAPATPSEFLAVQRPMLGTLIHGRKQCTVLPVCRYLFIVVVSARRIVGLPCIETLGVRSLQRQGLSTDGHRLARLVRHEEGDVCLRFDPLHVVELTISG